MEEQHGMRPLTADRIEAIEQQWRDLAGNDEFDAECGLLFDRCRDSVGSTPLTEFYTPHDNRCHAILDIYDTRRGTQTKLLTLNLDPSYWDAEDDLDVRVATTGIITAVFTSVVVYGKLNGVRDVKLYGRSNLMHRVLRAIEALWDSERSGVTAHLEGRWLRMEFAEEAS